MFHLYILLEEWTTIESLIIKPQKSWNVLTNHMGIRKAGRKWDDWPRLEYGIYFHGCVLNTKVWIDEFHTNFYEHPERQDRVEMLGY